MFKNSTHVRIYSDDLHAMSLYLRARVFNRVQEPYRGRARFFQKLIFYMVSRPKLMFFMLNFKGFPVP